MIHPKIKEIEKILDISFEDKELISRAFIHQSYANEHSEVSYDNLEFLGDGVLQSIISEYLYSLLGNNPSTHSEGLLTSIRSKIVRKDPLINAVVSMGLDKYILTGNGLPLSNIRGSKIISDIFESILGAIYLEVGYTATKEFAIRALDKQISNAFSKPSNNYKGDFQEYVQKNKLGNIEYNTKKIEDNHFSVNLLVDGCLVATGEGHNIKIAEIEAAKKGLNKFKK